MEPDGVRPDDESRTWRLGTRIAFRFCVVYFGLFCLTFAQITFALFGMPLLRAMQGDRQPIPKRSRARLQSALRQNPGRTGFYRAKLEGDVAIAATNQASGSPASLAHADALLILPADSAGLAAGDSIELIRLAEL